MGPRLQSAYARQMIAQPAPWRPSDDQSPIVVAGLFKTANGIGEAARSTYRALSAANLNPVAVDLSEPFAPVDMQTEIECQPMPAAKSGILILQLNGPETATALQHLGMTRGRSWYTIGYWAWELPIFPKGWEKAFRYLSEVWTISTFTADALSQHPASPHISIIGHAISPPEGLKDSRSKLGWSTDQFVFLSMADSMSSLQRKNPFAAIRAFKIAFGDDPQKLLVIKTRNLDRYLTARSDLLNEIGHAKNIEIIDDSISDEQKWSLIKSADALVSLHRSEGFGLTMAEAMAVGTTVICSKWSGNLDFTHSHNSALVNVNLVPCADEYGVYDNLNTQWADVEIHDAAQKMLMIANDRELRTGIARAAKSYIEQRASALEVGNQMARRLEEIPRKV